MVQHRGKMIFPTFLRFYGALFLFTSFLRNYATAEEDAIQKMLQERVSCFMVNTAAKIYRTNVLNKMYDKNMIFSPMDLYTSTALAYLGMTDDMEKRQLNNILGVKTFEKFLELNPEYKPLSLERKTETKMRKNLTNMNLGVIQTPDVIDLQYYDTAVNTLLGELVKKSLKKRNAAVRSGIALFLDTQYPINKTFAEQADWYYSFRINNTSFAMDPTNSTEEINRYIKQQTYQKITEFFDEPVPNTTQSVLTSSLTLVVNWEKMFQPNDSYETAFHTRDGECDDCDDVDICVMMNQGEIPYYNDSKVSAIALSTKNKLIKMYYVLPRDNQSLSEIISRPNKNFIQKIIDGIAPKRVVYHIPKMTMPGQIDQIDIFRSVGLKEVNLGRVASNLTLSIFKQKILLEINEEGIGGCPIGKSKEMLLMHESIDSEAVQFVADRPFLFFVYDTSTKMFLFYGAVFKPTGYTDF